MEATLVTTPHGELEVTVHTPEQLSRAMQRDLSLVLRAAGDEALLRGISVVPTCQHAKLDLVQIGPDVEAEKDRLLLCFTAWAQGSCDVLRARGFFADFCDPCSGLPFLTEGNTVYAEVESLQRLRGFKTSSAGACRVVLHPKWGTAIYPATMFTDAPVSVLREVWGLSSGQ